MTTNKTIVDNIITDLLSWHYYDYYDPSQDNTPNQRDVSIYGLPIFSIEYFKYV